MLLVIVYAVVAYLLFAAQHTVMARQLFKRHWGRTVPAPAWHLPGPASGVLLAIYAAGWVLVIGSTFAVSHAGLSGLR